MAGHFIADITTSSQILHKNFHHYQWIHFMRAILSITDVISPRLSCNQIQWLLPLIKHQSIHFTRIILSITDVISPRLSCNRIQYSVECFLPPINSHNIQSRFKFNAKLSLLINLYMYNRIQWNGNTKINNCLSTTTSTMIIFVKKIWNLFKIVNFLQWLDELWTQICLLLTGNMSK